MSAIKTEETLKSFISKICFELVHVTSKVPNRPVTSIFVQK